MRVGNPPIDSVHSSPLFSDFKTPQVSVVAYKVAGEKGSMTSEDTSRGRPSTRNVQVEPLFVLSITPPPRSDALAMPCTGSTTSDVTLRPIEPLSKTRVQGASSPALR